MNNVNKKFYGKFLQVPEGRNLDKSIAGEIWMSYPMTCLQHDGIKSDNTGKITDYNTRYKSRVTKWDGKI